ncbi:MAG TPA: cytidylate kinase family protein [Terriglobia bacterium]|nr:cytidylate kinase family protein [Terriglobia bacterium]
MAIITISRGSMSGGMAFAECLAKTLGYPSLAREVLVQAAGKLGVSEEKLRGKIEKSARFWERMTSDRRIYLIGLQSALADACVGGDLVYHGHAGHLLLKDLPNVLRVRLIAPMSERIREVMERQGLNYGSARDYIRLVDDERVRWTKFVYGLDWRDPQNYDIVLNLGNISISTACAMVAAAVKLPAFATTEETSKRFRDFALECRIKVALAANAKSGVVKFEVRADDGKVEVFGEVATGGVLIRQAGPSEEEVRLIAKTVDGVQEVAVNLRRFPEFAEP